MAMKYDLIAYQGKKILNVFSNGNKQIVEDLMVVLKSRREDIYFEILEDSGLEVASRDLQEKGEAIDRVRRLPHTFKATAVIGMTNRCKHCGIERERHT